MAGPVRFGRSRPAYRDRASNLLPGSRPCAAPIRSGGSGGACGPPYRSGGRGRPATIRRAVASSLAARPPARSPEPGRAFGNDGPDRLDSLFDRRGIRDMLRRRIAPQHAIVRSDRVVQLTRRLSRMGLTPQRDFLLDKAARTSAGLDPEAHLYVCAAVMHQLADHQEIISRRPPGSFDPSRVPCGDRLRRTRRSGRAYSRSRVQSRPCLGQRRHT